MQLGDYPQAIEEYPRAIELGGGDVDVYWCLGQSHLSLGQKPKALAAFVHVVERSPEFWPAVYHAAHLQEELQQFEPAYRHYQALSQVEDYAEEAQAAVR